MLKTNVEVITPAVAAEYLKTNTVKQRKLNKGQVAFYARMMSEGQWQLNGEPIVFDKDGHLVQGQHRCAACVLANVSFETAVTRGVEPDTFYTFDTGFNRSKGQILSIANIPNANNVGAAISSYIKMVRLDGRATSLDCVDKFGGDNAESNADRKVSTEDILNEYNERKEFWQELIREALRMCDRCRMMSVKEIVSIIAYLHLHKKYSLDYVVEFFTQLFYEETTEFDVIRKLRKKLVDDRMSGKRMINLVRTQIIVKAWDAYKTGTCPKILRYQKAVETPKFFD